MLSKTNVHHFSSNNIELSPDYGSSYRHSNIDRTGCWRSRHSLRQLDQDHRRAWIHRQGRITLLELAVGGSIRIKALQVMNHGLGMGIDVTVMW